MTGSTRPRTPGPLPRDARRAMAEAERHLAKFHEAVGRYNAIGGQLVKRFDRPLPWDALLFDVLTMIDVEPGDVWRWRGSRNNKGIAVMREPRTRVEISVVRFLALRFRIIGPNDFGALFPGPTGPGDVNPFHRTLRRAERQGGGNWKATG